MRTTQGEVAGVADVEGPVATVRSNVGESYVPDAVEIHYDDPRTALFDLLAGQVDGVVFPEPVIASLAVQAGVADRVRAVRPSLGEVRRAVAVRRDAPALRDRIDAAIEAVEASGDHEALYRRWYAPPPPWWADPRVGRTALGAAALAVVAALVWRLRLQRRLLDEARARAAAEAERRRTERRLEDVMAAAPDGVFFADADGYYVDVNAAGCTLLDRPREEIVGHHVSAFLAPEDLTNRPVDLEAMGPGLVSERTMLRADGTRVPVEISGGRLHDGTVLGMVRDLTPRKRSEAALLEREEQIRELQKVEAIGRLAGAVAHDFNNLLTVVLNDAEFLRDETVGEQRERAEEILGAARRAADLTRQLLAFGRRQVLQPVPIDPASVVERLRGLFARVLPPTVRLDVHASPGRATTVVDPGQLEQVLMNLVINARDALEPTGGEIAIRCDTTVLDAEEAPKLGAPEGGYAVIEVADTGKGMDAATAARVFEPYFTTKQSGKGTGLGLSTALGIVRQSGGWIAVRSEVGHGTTFRVGLPLTEAAPAPTPASAPTRPEPAAPGRVLVVEDDPAVRRLTVKALAASGYAVVEAASGEEGLRLAAAPDIVAVVTDVVMPGLGGAALAERLAADRPDLPVLFVSGYSNVALAEALASPKRAFLAKPFGPSHLGAALASLLTRASTGAPR